jgi:hypothetical protein
MAYRHGDRDQMQLLPPSIEEYVTLDDPVRAYNAFVESLSFDELGIIQKPKTLSSLTKYYDTPSWGRGRVRR